MVTWLVVLFNLSLAGLVLGLTLKVWRWRYQLLGLNQVLRLWQHQLHQNLPQTNQSLTLYQTKIHHWQQQSVHWRHRRRQIDQLLALIGIGQRWMGIFRQRHRR